MWFEITVAFYRIKILETFFNREGVHFQRETLAGWERELKANVNFKKSTLYSATDLLYNWAPLP